VWTCVLRSRLECGGGVKEVARVRLLMRKLRPANQGTRHRRDPRRQSCPTLKTSNHNHHRQHHTTSSTRAASQPQLYPHNVFSRSESIAFLVRQMLTWTRRCSVVSTSTPSLSHEQRLRKDTDHRLQRGHPQQRDHADHRLWRCLRHAAVREAECEDADGWDAELA
jgi:hypothetical protein